MRWKTEHRCYQTMNSITLLALLIFTSTSRGSSGSYLDFSGGKDFQTGLSEEEATFPFNAEDSTRLTTDSFETDPPYFVNSSDEFPKKINNATNLVRTLHHPIAYLTSVPPSSNEVDNKYLLHHFVVHPNEYLNYKTTFQEKEINPKEIPKRRDIQDEFFDSNNLPWSVDAYYQRPGQGEYVVDVNYLEDKDQDGSSVVVARGDESSQKSHAKHPQYFQKNYYYNYYPLVNERKVIPSRWGSDDVFTQEETKKRLDTTYGRKSPGANPCKQYLEFLKYAFEKIDEGSEYYYEPSESYVHEWRDRDFEKGHLAFGTQLLGPTFYVDNSGKISQVHNNGNSVQVAEGISPESKVSIFSNGVTEPKSLAQDGSGVRNIQITTNDYNKNEIRYLWHSNAFGDQITETETTTEVFHRVTAASSPGEKTTVDDYNTVMTLSPEEFLSRMGGSIDSSTPVPTTTYVSVPNDNRIRVKTVLSLQDTKLAKPEDADCKDKMLPCPDTVNITYPLNGYCNRYVSCESGKAIRRTCSDGLHFNIIIKSCDLPHNSICTYACPQPNGHFGIPGDCGGYFVCKDSIPEYRMCPPRMHWDVNRGTCTFSQFSSCPMRCFKDNEVRHYEGDCKAYIVCLNGIPYYHKCPPNMKFHETSLTCVPSKLSDCMDDPRLLTRTLNPNTLCKDVQVQLNTNAWCRSFLPFDYDKS